MSLFPNDDTTRKFIDAHFLKQKVRVSIPQEDALVRCRGTIAWAKFELPKPASPPVYRAGVEFLDVDAAAVDDFCQRNRQ